jgi:hypothetical protein
MVQQAARVGAPQGDRMSAAAAARPQDLGRDWIVLRDCRLRPSDRGVPPSVLIHPARGVAVVDILPSSTPDAAEAVRDRLDAARFAALFAGYLPIIHMQLTPGEMPFLPSLLESAFAARSPLRLPGGDAWTRVVVRALTTEQPAPRLQPQRSREDGGPTRRGTAEQPAPRPEPRRSSPKAGRGRKRRGTGVFLRRLGAAALSLAALGGVLAVLLGDPLAPPSLPTLPAPAPGAAPAATVAPMPEEVGPREAALPEPPPALADPVPVAPPPVLPERSEAVPPGGKEVETAAPVLEEALPVPLSPPAEVSPPRPPPARRLEAAEPPVPPSLPAEASPPAPTARRSEAAALPVPPPAPAEASASSPQRVAPSPPPPAARRSEAAAPAAARQSPEEKPAPPRARRRQEAGEASTRSAAGSAPPLPEAPPRRCERISALIGSGAPLGDSDMRFFNGNCIRW